MYLTVKPYMGSRAVHPTDEETIPPHKLTRTEGMTLVTLAISLIGIIVFLWDLITFPVYFLLQKPWKKQSKQDQTRAKIIAEEPGQITVRSVPVPCKLRDELQDKKIDTMDKLFNFCAIMYKNKNALGTREIYGEEDELQPNGKVFKKLQLGDYKWESYQSVTSEAEVFSKGLLELGLQPKDKIVLYANTSADWLISAIAAFKQSMSIVTIYTNLGEEGVIHGMKQTEAGVVIVSADLLTRLQSVLPHVPTVHSVVVLPIHKLVQPPTVAGVAFHTKREVIAMGDKSEKELCPPEPGDTAIIMYTSGSTGVPKGVVITHNNIVQGIMALLTVASNTMGEVLPHDKYVAYLPLAHVLELMAESIFYLLGVPLGYANTNTLMDTSSMVGKGSKGDLTVLKPTMMSAVPLVLDRVYKGLISGIKKKGAFFEALIDFAYNYRLNWTRRGYDTPILNRLIFSKLQLLLGGQIRVLLSGGAPLAPDAHDFCRTCLRTTLLQGYGLTETCATSNVTDKDDLKTGRIGPPLHGVDIKLVNWDEGGYLVTDEPCPRGELIIGGGNVAKEYFLMPEKTEEEFFDENGRRWFRTGDIGELSEDGCFKIIDRKKDLVKLQGGEYVSLGKVESLLKIHPLIENVCVYGDPNRGNIVALVVPDQTQLVQVAKKAGVDSEDREALCTNVEVVKAVLDTLATHAKNQKLVKFEIPQAIHLVSEQWTPEGGLVTAAMKLKRKSIENAFKDVIAALYSKDYFKFLEASHNNNV